MDELKTFISKDFRPEVLGGHLDKNHRSLFHLDGLNEEDEAQLTVNAICFGPKKDNVLIHLEHVINKEDTILVFYYEDIHHRWSYVNTNSDCYFLYKKNNRQQYKIRPKCLYIRGCCISSEDKYGLFLSDFSSFVELWQGSVLCSPTKQMANESKLFQLNTSLRKSAKISEFISLGKSYVVKGAKQFRLLPEDKSYIVKSLSGVRSIVVDEAEYKNWDLNSISYIPVLFQEKVNGKDLRAHVIDKKIFAKRSQMKEIIDYRYDRHFFRLDDIEHLEQEVEKFCFSVANEEDNNLLGIDFIQTTTGYVVLEANPSPGWSAYHLANGIDADPFILELLRVLKSG